MKKLQLKFVKHETKIGQKCEDIEPNVKEDCIFMADGKPIGFFIRKIKGNIKQYIEIANNEFRSDNVPKTILDRMSTVELSKTGMKRKEARKIGVSQYSTILGSIPPSPVMRRPYPTISSVHSVKTARTFIKAMLLASAESEKLIKEILPEQHKKQKEILLKTPKEYRFGNLFTSSISNYNISAPFHRDTGNLKETINVIITKRKYSTGGNLYIPDYDACIDQCDNSILVYPAWRNVHGVTPIKQENEKGYRNSLIFYPLKAFEKYNKEELIVTK